MKASVNLYTTWDTTLKGINKIHPRALQDLLEKVKNTREERIISTVMLRSLQKAKYTHLNMGHFGLAAKYYCHFTSPIRRYPDLIIHRIMKEYIKGQLSDKREEELNDMLPEIGRQCSYRERVAEEAERDTEDLKKVEYMKKFEGQEFEAIISNVTSFGMFVELDNTIEGLIRMSNMEDDYYAFNDKQYCLIGERTRKVYRIGDVIRVVLAKADIAARKIEFTIVPGEQGEEVSDDNAEIVPQEKPKRKRKEKIPDKDVLLHIQGKKKDKPKRRMEKSEKKKEKSAKKAVKSSKKRDRSSNDVSDR